MLTSKTIVKQLEKKTGIKSKLPCHTCNKKGKLTVDDNGLFYQCKNYCAPFTTSILDNINLLLTRNDQL